MNRFQLVLRSLWHYRRLNLAAAAGMFLGAAVITGALCVGDSLRGTLRTLAVRRLGRVAFALENRDTFRQELAAALGASKQWPVSAADPPAAVLRTAGTARRASGDELGVPARAVVLGVGPRFWKAFGPDTGGAAGQALGGRSAVLSKSLADVIGAAVGDAVIVTVGKEAAAPALSLFARRKQDATQVSFRVVVRAVLTDGPAFYSLRHDQYAPPNLFVDRNWLGRQVHAEGRANILLAAGAPGADAATPQTDSALAAALAQSATLADYGFRLSGPDPDARCTLAGRRLVLPGPAVRLVDRAAARSSARVMLTSFFLANSLEKAGDKGGAGPPGRAVPYSVMGALASFPPLDPVRFEDGRDWNTPLEPDEIVLNAWTARELRAGPGDRIRLRYYAMRDDGGLDAGTATLRLRGVLPMTSPLQTSTLVPRYRGITDAETLADWDPPFPVDLRRIQPPDEAYWRRYRTTPKAFVSAAFMRNLWQPRSPGAGEGPAGPATDWITTALLDFGSAPDPDVAREHFARAFLDELNKSTLRLRFRPVRREALAAAHGSSDFGGLFLGMSMFLIGAAGLFAGLAVRLNATRRARETGILLAVGWRSKTVRRLLLIEAATLAVVSGLLGLPAGVVYARMLIWGVNTRWRSIVGALPALQLHAVPATLAGGAAAGLLTGVLAAAWGGRVLTRRRPILLLSGWRALAGRAQPHLARRGWSVAALGVMIAVAVGWAALTGHVSAEAAFFAVGGSLLVGSLGAFAGLLARWRMAGAARVLSRGRLARRGLARYWLRNLLVAGVVACAVFLLITVAANERRVRPEELTDRSSPTGGFSLWVNSALPLRTDLPKALGELELTPGEKDVLARARFFPCRLSDGDGVSCLNVQQPAVPRVLGLSPSMIRRGGFRFRALDAQQRAAAGSTWAMLDLDPGSDVIPAFADADSAQWILHKSLGDEIVVPTATGRTVRLRLVGLLDPGIFAGELLIGERHFLRRFGDGGGYRVFLVDVPLANRAELVQVLRRHAAEFGLDVRTTEEILQAFLSVQNTYLATFGTLGGIALALGMLGVVLLLLRQVEERRADIALLIALGAPRRLPALLLVRETVQVPAVGACIGVACGLAAVAPHLLREHLPVPWGNIILAPVGAVLLGAAAVSFAAWFACRGPLLGALRSE